MAEQKTSERCMLAFNNGPLEGCLFHLDELVRQLNAYHAAEPSSLVGTRVMVYVPSPNNPGGGAMEYVVALVEEQVQGSDDHPLQLRMEAASTDER